MTGVWCDEILNTVVLCCVVEISTHYTIYSGNG